jgi:excisionase family DNA binding protein
MIKMKRGRPKKSAIPVVFKNDYLNITELSSILKLSKSHIYTLTSTKKIPHIKLLGKKLLFKRSEIDNWLTSKSIAVK